MNVEQLRRVLANLPGDMPVVVEDSKMGWMQNAALYVAPAHIDHCVSGNYLHASHRDDADNCDALLMSGFGQSGEDFVDISPQVAWLNVIDAEAEASLYETQDAIHQAPRLKTTNLLGAQDI